MCRLYGFRANETTKVECTLVRAQNALLLQSRGERRGIAHPDDWGIGYYTDGEPEVERRATAAHTDLHFGVTAERVFSRTVVAHVRKATVGQPAVTNTHPFRHGRWLFAHNGTVTGYAQVRERMETEMPDDLRRLLQGSTDSEHAFYWLLGRLRPDAASDEDRLRATLSAALTDLASWCEEAQPGEAPKLNFIHTDGAILVATRWNNSLWWVERRGVHDCEICGIPHIEHSPGAPYQAAVIASKPISHEAWREVPNHSLLVTDGAMRTTLQPI